MKKKIGFFGGTFDPIHLGHINIALQLLEMEGLDQVLFCPTSISPFKEKNPPIATPEQRKEMVLRAIDGIPQFALLDIEIENQGISYTIDTLKALEKMDAGENQYFILLAEDLLPSFHRWKDPEGIVSIAKPLVGTRLGSTDHNFEQDPPQVRKALLDGMRTIVSSEVSSTYIRERLKKKLCCAHLLPSKVLDYITQNRLYFLGDVP